MFLPSLLNCVLQSRSHFIELSFFFLTNTEHFIVFLLDQRLYVNLDPLVLFLEHVLFSSWIVRQTLTLWNLVVEHFLQFSHLGISLLLCFLLTNLQVSYFFLLFITLDDEFVVVRPHVENHFLESFDLLFQELDCVDVLDGGNGVRGYVLSFHFGGSEGKFVGGGWVRRSLGTQSHLAERGGFIKAGEWDISGLSSRRHSNSYIQLYSLLTQPLQIQIQVFVGQEAIVLE